jgi:hypothetical protein
MPESGSRATLTDGIGDPCCVKGFRTLGPGACAICVFLAAVRSGWKSLGVWCSCETKLIRGRSDSRTKATGSYTPSITMPNIETLGL